MSFGETGIVKRKVEGAMKTKQVTIHRDCDLIYFV